MGRQREDGRKSVGQARNEAFKTAGREETPEHVEEDFREGGNWIVGVRRARSRPQESESLGTCQRDGLKVASDIAWRRLSPQPGRNLATQRPSVTRCP